MNSISSYNLTFPTSQGFGEGYQSYSELQAARLSVSESQSKDITIVTAEGDRVTISTDQQSQAQLLTYEGLQRRISSAEYPGQSVVRNSLLTFKGEEFQSEKSSNISISVEGDLNKQEMKDIKAALKDIDKAMNYFLNGGEISDAAVKSIGLNDLDTIVGLEANYRYEKSVIFEQTTLKEATTYSSGGNLETSVFNKNQNHLDLVKSLAEELTNIIKESNIEPSKFKKPLQKLFSDYKNNPKENEPQDNHRTRMREWIETELLKKLPSISKKVEMVSDSAFQNLHR